MEFIKAFIVGGLICVVAQILMDTTKLTPARILVIFVTLGTILGAFGIYDKIVDFGGAGAIIRCIYWRNNRCCRRNNSCNLLWIYNGTYI